jgi:Reverse transcriptase (RNA-dependent DNA polymerase)
MGYIWPTWSSHRALILFVKKKSGELQLCVDFRELNKTTKKDCYLLLLIIDLLDAPRKAWIYTKIDLQHAFHLVRVAKGDKWKTAFHTCYGSFEWQSHAVRLDQWSCGLSIVYE